MVSFPATTGIQTLNPGVQGVLETSGFGLLETGNHWSTTRRWGFCRKKDLHLVACYKVFLSLWIASIGLKFGGLLAKWPGLFVWMTKVLMRRKDPFLIHHFFHEAWNLFNQSHGLPDVTHFHQEFFDPEDPGPEPMCARGGLQEAKALLVDGKSKVIMYIYIYVYRYICMYNYWGFS